MPSTRLLVAAAGALALTVGGALVAGRIVGPPERAGAEVVNTVAEGHTRPAGADSRSGTSGDSSGGTEVDGAETVPLPGIPRGTTATSPAPLPGATRLPDAGTRRGGAVTGYPARVIPAVPGSSILTTSVSPGQGRFQAALVGKQSQGPASRSCDFYRERLTRLGFTEVTTEAVSGSDAAGFTRGESSVVVTATPGRPTDYSVYAVLAVGKR